jgi:AraC-like DNA-binding protein
MRLWQVNFQVYKHLNNFPYPGDLVEEIQTTPDYLLEGRSRTFNGAQLVLTVKGTGGFRLDNTDLRLHPGMAFLACHGDPRHAYYYPPEGTEPWVFFWIAFFGNPIDDMVKSMNERYGYIYNLDRTQGIIKRLYAYKSYRGSVQVMTPLNGAKFVMDILSALAEEKEKELIKEPQSNLVRLAQEQILQNMETNIGVTEIATTLNISREHLSRIFKDQTGMSPYEFIQFKKIQFACHLLKENQLSCKEISARIGYDNITTFNRAFKRIVKMSPSDYRTNSYTHYIT